MTPKTMTPVLSSFASPAGEVMLNAVCFCIIICDSLQLRQGETKKYALHTFDMRNIAGEKQVDICPDPFLMQPQHLPLSCIFVAGWSEKPQNCLTARLSPMSFPRTASIANCMLASFHVWWVGFCLYAPMKEYL